MVKKTKTFNQAYKKLLAARQKLETAGNNARRNLRSIKSHGYDACKELVFLQGSDPNRLRELCISEVGDGPNWLDRYIEMVFADLELVGDTYQELVTAIHGNMSKAKFLAKSARHFLGETNRTKKPQQSAKLPVPSKPLDDMDEAEQLEHWRTRCLTSEERLREATKRICDLERDRAKDQRQIKKLHKLLMQMSG